MEDVEYAFEQIEDLRRAGHTLQQALERIRRNPYGPPPPDLLERAELLFLERTGAVSQVTDPSVLVERENDSGSWYAGPRKTDVFWPPYQKYLADTIGDAATESVHEASSKILELMRPPGERFNTRGLVLGYVQSGKTTSFISLIAKAADAGYKLFIVLSGVTDNLRSQTQDRIDQFVGITDATRWEQLTDADRDFHGLGANLGAQIRSADTKLIAVVKKNPARLRRLVKWLDETPAQLLSECPIILIDDEADQASINVGSKGRTSTINALMRKVLARPKSAYVAYTATPFANLLIDPKDSSELYPRHFLVSLPKPSGYFGSEQIFGTAAQSDDPECENVGLDLVRTIGPIETDTMRPPRPASAIEDWNPEVPEAMQTALLWFIMATATRRLRGQGNPHSTMLIHTSMLASAHIKLHSAITAWLNRILNEITQHDSKVWDDLRQIWENERPRSTPEIAEEFEEIRLSISDNAPLVKVIYDNYRSTERLTYAGDEPVTTIVIGGNTLSRGLTLEGLTSSYFVRSASAYDTLLQMGRWFGYRTHYEDLVRIWMPDELQTWFRDLSFVESEIRQQIIRYEAEKISPLQAGVKIRTHPAMAITAAAKMRSAVDAQITYSRTRAQTILFRRQDAAWLGRNIEATKKLVADLVAETGTDSYAFPSGRRGFEDVSAQAIFDFLDGYSFHENAMTMRADLLKTYIANENDADALLRWNVVFIEGKKSASTIDLGLNESLSLNNRSQIASTDLSLANLKSIASTNDRISDLPADPSTVREQLKSMRKQYPGVKEGDHETPLVFLREALLEKRGLLCIYPIDKDSQPQTLQRAEGPSRKSLSAADTLIGVAIFFPDAANPDSTVSYKGPDLSGQLYEDQIDEMTELAAADSADAGAIELVTQ